jgi:hypothetical protein
VTRWVQPEEFVELQAEAEEIGFAGVLSGPLVRSSYRAGRLYRQAIEARQESGAALPPDRLEVFAGLFLPDTPCNGGGVRWRHDTSLPPMASFAEIVSTTVRAATSTSPRARAATRWMPWRPATT